MTEVRIKLILLGIIRDSDSPGTPAGNTDNIEQTVKELVDNAVDSCRWRSSEQDAPTVRVVLRRLPAGARNSNIEHTEERDPDEDALELQVADNGSGLNDVTKVLALFSSTKSGYGLTAGSSAGAHAGKYGLGLTLSLLYSQKFFGGFLKATTATLGSSEWCFTKCSIDLDSGQPRAVYQKSGLKPASWSQGSGTDMRLLVPGGEEALHYAEPRLKTLFARMHLLPDRAAGITFACEGCLDDISIFVPRGGREASPHLLVDNEDLVQAFATGLTAMARVNDGTLDTRLGEEAIRSGNEKSQQLRGTRIQSGALKNKTGSFVDGQTSAPFRSFRDEDVSVFECQGKRGTRITAAVAVERPTKRWTCDENHAIHPAGGDLNVPLFVHRFANGVPLLDTNTSSACALVAGVSKAGWRSLGLKISASRVLQSEGRLRFTLSEAPTPLKVKGGASWSALADIKAVHVAVTANSETVPYTSLRKDAIAHKEGYVSATSNAVRDSLLFLSNNTSGGFRSAAEAAQEMMQEDLIPLMANNIASMVHRSEDISFQKRCLNVLGVGNEYVQQQRLSDLLESELRENIQEEEERRAAAKSRVALRRAEEAEGTRNKSTASPEEGAVDIPEGKKTLTG